MSPIGDRLGLLWGLTVFAGSMAQLLGQLSGLPTVVLLLASGLLIGRAGFDLVDPGLLGSGLEPIVGLLVSLVLFDGGLNLRLAGREPRQTLLRIVLVRGLVGLAGSAALAHGLAGLDWPVALVFGGIVLATGPTVITPMVQQMRLKAPLAQVLEAEGLVLEPFSAVLAALLLELALGELDSWGDLAGALALRMGGGALAGALAGFLLAAVLQRLPATGERSGMVRLQVTLGLLFLLFSGAEALLPEAGLPAAVTAGVVVGWRLDTEADQLDVLIRQMAQLAITMLFPLLAADVSWGELSPLGWGGVACVLGLMLLRLLLVQVAGVGLPLGGREKFLLSWIAPRGIVTAAVASLFAIRLEDAGVPGATLLKGLVFLTILLTVGLQGFTAPALARHLELVDPEPEATAGGSATGASEAALEPGEVLATGVE
ncbi:cation:proton antiporter [Cyanobium sp. Morenito 9A2]|nr:cation:proton antiporter [Cyanobium sp. Morenito 9A2]MCP9850173.1 cation:proton antiporter [Cyanobium sp. Morenito 9A2]